MSASPCLCGSIDCRSCGPAQGYDMVGEDDEYFKEDRRDYEAEKAHEDALFNKFD